VLAPVFSVLPKPVLAALIIEAVVMGMMDVPEMRRLARVQRFDFWIAIAAIIATLLVGVPAGVLIGIGLSLIWLISVATRPHMPLLGREPGTQVFRDLDEHPGDEQYPGVVVLRVDGGLFFATSDAPEDRSGRSLCPCPRSPGSCSIARASTSSTPRGRPRCAKSTSSLGKPLSLRVARVKPAVREVLARDGTLARIGEENIHGNVDHAVKAQIAAQGGSRADL
jgi:sulfate permease, SulP family